jgi:hypothetical protein
MTRSARNQADDKGLTQSSKATKYGLVVLREVCDSYDEVLGVLCVHYDGSVEDAITAAERITNLMYRRFGDASNIQSRIGATDEAGRGRWLISPNFSHVAEVGTSEAAEIFGHLNFTQAV